jgi:putative ABC transport system ATP-binding protein
VLDADSMHDTDRVHDTDGVTTGSAPDRRDRRLVATYAVGLTKIYKLGDRPALDTVDVAFGAGELSAIVGPHGAGKSTLLACLAGHEPPSSGQIFVGRSGAIQSTVCRKNVGFVLEHSRPLGGCTVRENMQWTGALSGTALDGQRTRRIANILGLIDDLDTPLYLLTAERKHLAVCAAALVPLPPVLVVDEPHGSVSAETFETLHHCAADLGCAVVAVASDPAVAARADHVLFLSAGRVAGMLDSPTAQTVRRAVERLTHRGGPIPARMFRRWARSGALATG